MYFEYWWISSWLASCFVIQGTGTVLIVSDLEEQLQKAESHFWNHSIMEVTKCMKYAAELTCAIMERIPRTAINAATLSDENPIIYIKKGNLIINLKMCIMKSQTSVGEYTVQ